jgi:hypothetical protein
MSQSCKVSEQRGRRCYDKNPQTRKSSEGQSAVIRKPNLPSFRAELKFMVGNAIHMQLMKLLYSQHEL